MTERRQKILVVRPDRIGDVVLSTPVFQALKAEHPSAEIWALVKEEVFPVVQHNPFLTGVMTYKPQSVHKGLAGLWRLIREIKGHGFNTSVTLQVQFRIALATLIAGIGSRVGPYSKWYSYFLFNRGIRQRRSSVEMHEADYNLMLLRRLGVKLPTRKFEPLITVDADAKERMRKFLREENVPDGSKFVVIHPGMGGSALNWPVGYYIDLAGILASRGIPVFVAGSTVERDLVDKVVTEASERARGSKSFFLKKFISPNTHSGLSDYIALQSLSALVVAPSTGPLHIATALGKPTVSFYPPIKVQSALRWGPYQADESRHSVLVPDALCGQHYKCVGKRCPFYFCMERLSVEEAVGQVVAQLEKQP